MARVRARRQRAEKDAVQREERRARHQARRRLQRWMYLGVSGVIAVLITVSLFLPRLPSRNQASDQAVVTIEEGQEYAGYASRPPTYGPRWPTAAEWGVHTEEIPNPRQVANLAEGGVFIQYKTSDEELAKKLGEFAKGQANFPCYIVVAPYASMETAIAVTAWGAKETMDAYDEAKLKGFVETYRGQGPQVKSCTP
ncbi:MAG: DUF3105 domain-containing protein [Dehalococcoidia bacterium]|nr:DUF3105 domain-containing protein [Dehalococcoidia bacterium]